MSCDRHAGHAEAADQHGRRRPRRRRPPRRRRRTDRVTRSPMRRSPAPRPAPGRRRCRSRRRPTGRRTRAAAAARVPRIRPPEAPSGWPIAIAPPLALTISGSILPGVDAGQRLHGEGLVELDRGDVGPGDAGPARAPVRRPRRARSRTSAARARRRRGRRPGRAGRRPIRAAAASEPSSSAEAPSLSGEALPAVIVPSGPERRLQRRPASRRWCRAGCPRRASQVGAGRPAPPGRRRSRRPRPRRRGWCERAANSSCRSREIAEPLAQLLVGLAQRDRPLGRHPLVDQPPAQRRGDRGDVAGREGARRLGQHPRRPGHRLHAAGDARRRRRRTRSAREAIIAASSDEPQSRLTVVAGTETGSPASSTAIRPTLRLSSPAPLALPQTTSPIAAGSRSGAFASTPRQRGGGEVVGADLGQRAAEPAERRAGGGVQERLVIGLLLVRRPSRPARCWAIRNAVLASGTPQ